MDLDTNEVERRIEHFKEAIKRAGVKLTHQRLEIFREVASSEAHPSAETVYSTLQERMPMLSHDTVYRTLWLLSDLGLVSTLGPKRESVRFDANLVPHHHYICIRCGYTRDFESDELNGLNIPASISEFGSVDNTHVEVRGICRRCLGEDSKETAS